MARLIGLVLAIATGALAAILLASNVAVMYAGERTSCSTVINAAAVDDASANPRVEAACHEALVDRTELAGLAVLVCIAAGSGWAFAGREPQPA